MQPTKTKILTQDNLHVYDLAPAAAELKAVAGPDGYQAEELNFDDLPKGFRVIEASEWEKLHNQT